MSLYVCYISTPKPEPMLTKFGTKIDATVETIIGYAESKAMG